MKQLGYERLRAIVGEMSVTSSSIAQAVSDLLADVERPSAYDNVLRETAAFYGLNPILLDNKFRETHGDPEAAITKKMAALKFERHYQSVARKRLRYYLSKGDKFSEKLLDRVGTRIVYENRPLYLIGFQRAGRLGYLFVEEGVSTTFFLSYRQTPDWLSDRLPWH